MTRKDYVALAEALKMAHPEGYEHNSLGARITWIDCLREVADVLAADNPRFDRARFIAAAESK